MTGGSDKDPFATGGGLDILSGMETDQEDGFIDRTLGDYRITGLIAEGGMGRVYRATRIDGSFEREVAVKISPVSGMDARARERFLQEQSVLAALNHPNISQLYDARVTEEGWPYIVMELIEGPSIEQYCAEQQLDEDERIRILVDVVGAVAYAHARLIVHRDLKPSNILVDEEGRAKLLDFGIAKLIDESKASETYQRPMTPRYASPEQLLGQPVQVASDVYQLGLLIYEVITGEPLDQDTTLSEAIQAAAETGGVRLTAEQRSKLPPDLLRIVEHALRNDPDDRYSSAAELRDDLEAYLGGFPVQAAGQSAVYRTVKFLRRNRLPVAIGTGALAFLVVATTWYTIDLAKARDAAEAQAQVAAEEAEAAYHRRLETEAALKFFKAVFRSIDVDTRPLDQITVKDMLLDGVSKVREILPEKPHVRVPVLNEFAMLYYQYEMYDAAEDLIDLARESAAGGAADPWEADQADLVKQAMLFTQDRYSEALEINRQRWERIADYAESNEQWVRVRQMHIAMSLAENYRKLGELGDAANWFRQSLGFDEALEMNPDLHVNIIQQLGIISDQQRQFKVAHEYYEQALDLARSKLGDDHVDTAVILQSLGAHHAWQADNDTAYDYFERANAIYERVYGRDSTKFAEGLENLGSVESARGNLDVAATYFQEAVEKHANLQGTDSAAYANALKSLASVYRRQGRLDDAATAYARSLAIFEAGVGEFSWQVDTYHGAAATARLRGNPDESGVLLASAYGKAALHWDENDTWMSRLYAESAMQAWDRDDASSARNHWDKVEAIADAHRELNDASLLEATREYFAFLAATNRQDEIEDIVAARPFLQIALE